MKESQERMTKARNELMGGISGLPVLEDPGTYQQRRDGIALDLMFLAQRLIQERNFAGARSVLGALEMLDDFELEDLAEKEWDGLP